MPRSIARRKTKKSASKRFKITATGKILLSLPRLKSLFRKRTEEEVQFYEITPAQRAKMAFMYFGLIAALAYQMHATEKWLAPYHKM